ncbi:MAG: acyltransferase family protein [Armatimonadota bacterium]
MAQPSVSRLPQVDGLRALAALYVVIFHAQYLVYPLIASFPSRRLFFWHLLPVFRFGHFAVTVFIVISGFCLMLPVIRRDYQFGGWWAYLMRRARRIWPPYYAGFALSFLFIIFLCHQPTGTSWDITQQWTWQSLLAHHLMLQEFIDPGRTYGSAWSLAVEWKCYLLFPLVVLAWRKFGAVKTAAGALLLATAAGLLARGTFWANGVWQYYGLFVAGMLAADLATAPRYAALRSRIRWDLLAVILVVGWVLACAVFGRDAIYAQIVWSDVAVGLISVVGLVAVSQPGSRLSGILAWRPLAAVGVFSYSLYLLHWPLLQLCWQYVLAPLGLADERGLGLLILLGVPFITAASYLFFRLFEQPFMSSKPAYRVQPAPVQEPEGGRVGVGVLE